MKMILIAVVCLAVGFGGALLMLNGKSPESGIAKADSTQLYTCGMHPEIVSNEPGICPICKMNLTPKRDAANNEGSVRIDPATSQNMGLVTELVRYESIGNTIRLFGKVTVPDPNRFTVNSKVDGWIEQLFVSEKGEQVGKGQPLLTIYSPDLVAAQKEFVTATSRASANGSLARMAELAEDRLRNWDIPEDQIAKLRSGQEVNRELMIRSPFEGVVTKKAVNEGSRISAQTTLFELANLNDVWITAFVYEQDLWLVEIGQSGRVTVPSIPGTSFDARVVYVSPMLDDRGQVEIRFALDNPEMKLRPEMYAEVAITSESVDRLVIPRKAIINSGNRQLVFRASADDRYEPVQISTGVVSREDRVEISSGLAEGDLVVVSGQFLLDSESRLSEALTSSAHAGHGGPVPDKNDEAATNHSDHSHVSGDPYDIHTCPMPIHFDVLNYGPGQCSECGMDLVPLSETENKPVYVCPMPECGVAEKEPGQCPVCNMNLIEYQPEKSHDQ